VPIFRLHGEMWQRAAIGRLSRVGAPALTPLPRSARGPSALGGALGDGSGNLRVNALAAVAELRPRWLKAGLRRPRPDEKTSVRQLAARLPSDS